MNEDAHDKLIREIKEQNFIGGCYVEQYKEPYMDRHGEQSKPDILAVDKEGRCTTFEIKISEENFLDDMKGRKKRKRYKAYSEFLYYVIPETLFQKRPIPKTFLYDEGIGLIISGIKKISALSHSDAKPLSSLERRRIQPCRMYKDPPKSAIYKALLDDRLPFTAPSNLSDRVMTLRDIALLCGASRNVVYGWLKNTTVRREKVGTSWHISLFDIIAEHEKLHRTWVEQGYRNPADTAVFLGTSVQELRQGPIRSTIYRGKAYHSKREIMKLRGRRQKKSLRFGRELTLEGREYMTAREARSCLDISRSVLYRYGKGCYPRHTLKRYVDHTDPNRHRNSPTLYDSDEVRWLK